MKFFEANVDSLCHQVQMLARGVPQHPNTAIGWKYSSPNKNREEKKHDAF
jgi:hypothetical protein